MWWLYKVSSGCRKEERQATSYRRRINLIKTDMIHGKLIALRRDDGGPTPLQHAGWRDVVDGPGDVLATLLLASPGRRFGWGGLRRFHGHRNLVRVPRNFQIPPSPELLHDNVYELASSLYGGTTEVQHLFSTQDGEMWSMDQATYSAGVAFDVFMGIEIW
jgi:hypothetical protein